MKSYLKLISIYILRLIMRILYLFPIKKHRVIFNSYRGSQYSCNPKYISEYLKNNYSDKVEIIWAFREPNKYYFLKSQGIKVIKYASLQRFYYEATAEYSINNVGSFSWLPLRKHQHHINTWHGGGCYKRASLGEKANDKIYLKTLLMTVKETSAYIASSQFFRDNVIPNDFGFYGKTLDIGMPRNDILFKKNKTEIKTDVLNKLGIQSNCFIVLYAPTWRYNMYDSIELPDFNMIKSEVKKHFRRTCEVLYRAHPNLKSKFTGNFIDVSKYPDMQELLVASDMLISDYSSSIWDFSILLRPCLLFVPDLQEYNEERGFVININEWGFPIARNNKDLQLMIRECNQQIVEKNMKEHQKKLGTFENGTASKKICSMIIESR